MTDVDLSWRAFAAIIAQGFAGAVLIVAAVMPI